MSKENFNPFTYPEISDLFGTLLESLTGESGRGAVLVAQEYVSDHLKQLIEVMLSSRMTKAEKEKLFKYPGQLSSFNSQIELAYAFRVIPERVRNCLHALRSIRNSAAHGPKTFELLDLNEKLSKVYDLGPGTAQVLKEKSWNIFTQYKLSLLENMIDENIMTRQEHIDIFMKKLSEDDTIRSLERQAPHWELAVGLTYVCAWLAHIKHQLKEILEHVPIISDLPQAIQKGCFKDLINLKG
jgi:uncharacterized protein DUF4145